MTSRLTDSFLRDIWYFALPSKCLKAGSLTSLMLLGEPVVLGRKSDNKIFALRDFCPHRGIPLSDGRIVKDEIECCYHGWRFNSAGVCTFIPSLVDGQKMNLSNIKVLEYPVRESAGCIWIFIPKNLSDFTINIPAPNLSKIPGKPVISEKIEFPCNADHAVIGLMDPAHGPFVHTSWWWRSKKSIHEKRKRFGPSEYGFCMLRHEPSRNSAAYKILGKNITTEIVFRLPGIRIEYIETARNSVVGLTAVTPCSANLTVVHHLVYWTIPWLTLIKPALKPYLRKFLKQDRDIVSKQQRGLQYEPNLLLINDSDAQAKWYYRLKKAYTNSIELEIPFENPIKETTLRWRS